MVLTYMVQWLESHCQSGKAATVRCLVSSDTIIASRHTAASEASCWFGARSLYTAGALTFICRQTALTVGLPIRRSTTAGHAQHSTAHSPTPCTLLGKLSSTSIAITHRRIASHSIGNAIPLHALYIVTCCTMLWQLLTPAQCRPCMTVDLEGSSTSMTCILTWSCQSSNLATYLHILEAQCQNRAATQNTSHNFEVTVLGIIRSADCCGWTGPDVSFQLARILQQAGLIQGIPTACIPQVCRSHKKLHQTKTLRVQMESIAMTLLVLCVNLSN